MKYMTCIKCKENREEIEFEFLYFKNKYDKVCKHCDDKFKKIFRNIKDETPKKI